MIKEHIIPSHRNLASSCVKRSHILLLFPTTSRNIRVELQIGQDVIHPGKAFELIGNLNPSRIYITLITRVVRPPTPFKHIRFVNLVNLPFYYEFLHNAFNILLDFI